MANNLTDVAIKTRKAIRYSLIFLVLILLLRIILSFSFSLYRNLVPEPTPEPTISFGPLPKIQFPKQEVPKNINYSIETTTGELPILETQANVYFIPKPPPTLFSLDTATSKAATLGFTGKGTEVSSSIHQFSSPKTPATIQINIITGDFSISYDLSQDTSPISSQPPAPEIAVNTPKSILSRASSLPDDLSGPTSHSFLEIQGQSLVPSLSLSEADFTKVNLYRKPLGKDYPSVTSTPDEANVWFILSGAREREKQVIAAEYHHFPVDEEQLSTYPLKTSQKALEDLIAGDAFIASAGNTENVIIRKVFLAYFDPVHAGTFLQPIVVFEGDNNFVAYVPAVIQEYYGAE